MSHFSAIGFAVETEQDYVALLDQAIPQAEEIETEGGTYLVWSPGADIELWVQANLKNEIMGCNPHLSGKGRMPARNPNLMRSADYPLEGSMHVEAAPAEDDPTGVEYPFMVDVPDFELMQAAIGDAESITLQIAAFAHEIQYYTDDADFAQRGGERQMAVESAIPVGLFLDEQHPEPKAFVLYTGRVLVGEQRINPATNMPFYYALLKTLTGTVDVVADVEMLSDLPEMGGIIQGIFWLSARLVDASGNRGKA